MGEQQTGAASVQNELRTGPRRCHVGVPLDLGETALWLVRGPPSIPAALWSPPRMHSVHYTFGSRRQTGVSNYDFVAWVLLHTTDCLCNV